LSEKNSLLRLLAAGSEPDAPADDVRTALRQAADLVARERPLLPPAEAALVDGLPGVLIFAAMTRSGAPVPTADAYAGLKATRPSAHDLESLHELSKRVLGALLQTERFAEEVQGIPPEQQSLGLQYAEAVLRQAEVVTRLEKLGSDAPLQSGLADPERERVDAFLLYRNLRGRFQTLDSLVASWRRLARLLADRPQSLQFEEYCDWLVRRDDLEEILMLLSPTTRRDIERGIRDLDERFAQSTISTPVAVRRASPWSAQRWWWYRRPEPIAPDFLARLP
jgi:hypothetical protein